MTQYQPFPNRPKPIRFERGFIGLFERLQDERNTHVVTLVYWEGMPPVRIEAIRDYHFLNDALAAFDMVKQGKSIDYVQNFRHGPEEVRRSTECEPIARERRTSKR